MSEACSARWLNRSARASERDDTTKSVPPFSVRWRVSKWDRISKKSLAETTVSSPSQKTISKISDLLNISLKSRSNELIACSI